MLVADPRAATTWRRFRAELAAAGGGLTEVASAYLMEPRIAERLTLVWIGGLEHAGDAEAPPGALPVEYNLGIDLIAAQVVFQHSNLRIWQVPRNVYRQCLVSQAELRGRVMRLGPVGAHLYELLHATWQWALEVGLGANETCVLGDSPLVLLTALHSTHDADPSSSRYRSAPVPAIDDRGRYQAVPAAREMRVYTSVDTRLMVEDFFFKLADFARWQAGR